MLVVYDEAQSVLDPSDDETLWKSRQHVLDLVAHSPASTPASSTSSYFRALADTDALEAFADLDAINRVGSEDFVADTAAVSDRSNRILLLVGAVLIGAVAATMLFPLPSPPGALRSAPGISSWGSNSSWSRDWATRRGRG